MYAQSFLVTSVRGIGLLPTTSASDALGVIGFMNAAFGLRADFFAFLAIFNSLLYQPRWEAARDCSQRSTTSRVFPLRKGVLHRGNHAPFLYFTTTVASPAFDATSLNAPRSVVSTVCARFITSSVG